MVKYLIALLAMVFGLFVVGCSFHGAYSYGVRTTSGIEVWQQAPTDGASFNAKNLVEHIGDVKDAFTDPVPAPGIE